MSLCTDKTPLKYDSDLPSLLYYSSKKRARLCDWTLEPVEFEL